jgi:hypothetical protein
MKEMVLFGRKQKFESEVGSDRDWRKEYIP